MSLLECTDRQCTRCYYYVCSACDKGKGKGQETCYSAAYTSQTRDQQRFTILEVAADWHVILCGATTFGGRCHLLNRNEKNCTAVTVNNADAVICRMSTVQVPLLAG